MYYEINFVNYYFTLTKNMYTLGSCIVCCLHLKIEVCACTWGVSGVVPFITTKEQR